MAEIAADQGQALHKYPNGQRPLFGMCGKRRRVSELEQVHRARGALRNNKADMPFSGALTIGNGL